MSGFARRCRTGAVVAIAVLGFVACERSGSPTAAGTDAALHESERMKMGTRFGIKVVAPDARTAGQAMDAAWAEIDRIEALLSEWRDDSEISEVNRRAGGPPVRVGPELLHVVDLALELSEQTDGAFDITFAACGKLWSFTEPRLPDDDALAACLERVDYRRVELDREASTIRLPAGMKIGIAGIGKGYGVDRAAETLELHGITDYIVDGGGDIRLRGRRLDRPWRVGIADPRRHGSVWASVEVPDGAIVTSGDYERFFEKDGVRYHHILDPATGRPARGSVAVTVVAPDATRADALATGLFVLGPERALARVERMPGVEALIFGPDLEPRSSSGFPAWSPADGAVASGH